jgi:hypothetical protein
VGKGSQQQQQGNCQDSTPHQVINALKPACKGGLLLAVPCATQALSRAADYLLHTCHLLLLLLLPLAVTSGNTPHPYLVLLCV